MFFRCLCRLISSLFPPDDWYESKCPSSCGSTSSSVMNSRSPSVPLPPDATLHAFPFTFLMNFSIRIKANHWANDSLSAGCWFITREFNSMIDLVKKETPFTCDLRKRLLTFFSFQLKPYLKLLKSGIKSNIWCRFMFWRQSFGNKDWKIRHHSSYITAYHTSCESISLSIRFGMGRGFGWGFELQNWKGLWTQHIYSWWGTIQEIERHRIFWKGKMHWVLGKKKLKESV